jgi:hypothetical protein
VPRVRLGVVRQLGPSSGAHRLASSRRVATSPSRCRAGYGPGSLRPGGLGGRSSAYRVSDAASLTARRCWTLTQYSSRVSGFLMARRSNGRRRRSHAVNPGAWRRARSAASSASRCVVMHRV